MVTGKNILILSANSSLASALLELLDFNSNNIGLHYNQNKKDLDRFQSSRTFIVQGDLSLQKSANEVIDQYCKKFGEIDILINFTGGVSRKIPWAELAQNDIEQDLRVNLLSCLYVAQRFVYWLKDSTKLRKIIFFSTASATHGGGGDTLAYGLAKSAIHCLVKRLAKDLASKNTLVNAIAPGFFPTQFHTKTLNMKKGDLEKRGQFVPLGRSGDIEEIGSLIQYLISDSNKFMTGEILKIDGGDFI